MAISSASGFSIGSSDAIDDRLVLTKAQMKSANDNVFPDVYMCVCSDDGNIYTYNKTNEIDETTGKFRIFESGGGLPEPESKDKLLLSSENETTSELEWKQVDKSEVGLTEWTGTTAEFEALDKSTLQHGTYLNITDDETNIIDDTEAGSGKTYSSNKIESIVNGVIKTKKVTATTTQAGGINLGLNSNYTVINTCLEGVSNNELVSLHYLSNQNNWWTRIWIISPTESSVTVQSNKEFTVRITYIEN